MARRHRSKAHVEGKLSGDVSQWRPRSKRTAEIYKQLFDEAREVQAKYAAGRAELLKNEDLKPESIQRKIDELRAGLLDKFNRRSAMGLAVAQANVEEVYKATEAHGQTRPFAGSWPMDSGAPRSEHIAAYQSRLLEQLMSRTERARAEDLIEKLLAADKHGGKLIEVARQALKSDDPLTCWAWEQAGGRVELLGSEAAKAAWSMVLAEAEDARIEANAPEELLVEHDEALEVESIAQVAAAVVSELNSATFATRATSTTLSNALPVMGSYFAPAAPDKTA